MSLPESRRLSPDDYRILVEASPDPLTVLDGDGVLRYASPALAQALGYPVEDLEGQSALAFVHPEDAEAVRAVIADAIGGLEMAPHDVRVRRTDGSWKTFETIGRRFVDRAGVPAAVFHCRDVSQRTAGEALLRYQAAHDPLTGLPNRSAFLERLERTMARSRRPPHHLYAVLFVDLDRFKLVNDSLGHVSGDNLGDLDSVIAVLRALKSLDIELHLDDFGTGYSSLSYLYKLPADAVKIDRSFVSRMGRDPDAPVMVRTIIDLAHNLGRRVVAEGIETEDQLRVLRSLGCDHGQGYLFARPMPGEATLELLASKPRW